MSRPSVHDTFTKSYAIDQIDDIEYLRAVAHRMWEAFFACHSQEAHVFGALLYGECRTCVRVFEGGEGEPCEQYQGWQKKITDGFRSV